MVDQDLGPGNKVIKNEIASAFSLIPSEEGVDYDSDGDQNVFDLTKEVPSVEQDEWFDCEEPWPADVQHWCDAQEEHWFDTHEDFWYTCSQPPKEEKWYECRQPCEDVFYECRQYAPGSEPKPYKAVPEPSLYAFPCVLMALSSVMLSMHTVGMLLKQVRLQWGTVECNLFRDFKFLDSLKAWLTFILWPPPEYMRAKERHEAECKKLLLTALAIAIMKADSAAPAILVGNNKNF